MWVCWGECCWGVTKIFILDFRRSWARFILSFLADLSLWAKLGTNMLWHVPDARVIPCGPGQTPEGFISPCKSHRERCPPWLSTAQRSWAAGKKQLPGLVYNSKKWSQKPWLQHVFWPLSSPPPPPASACYLALGKYLLVGWSLAHADMALSLLLQLKFFSLGIKFKGVSLFRRQEW